MKPTSILRKAGLSFGVLFACATAHAEESQFEKDRTAILAMAGKFKVTFNFHETYSTAENYTIKEKKYREQAHEMVKVIEDTGKRIVLQHLLQVEGDEGTMVVKHWGQIWTYEDREILEYQKGKSWKKKTITADEARGTWTQYVTQVDESPRYENLGTWDHSGEMSQWVSAPTPRPLPRREYTKRKDYDVLFAINTHAITPQGWVHEQTNRKQVKRDGKNFFLCNERGFNTYERVPEHDFSVAESYWKTHAPFWDKVRSHWDQSINKSTSVSYTSRIKGVSMRKALSRLMADEEEKQPAKIDDIPSTLATYQQLK